MASLFSLEDKIKLEAQKYYTDGYNSVTDEAFDEMVGRSIEKFRVR